jgi:hypothetical protein
MKALTELVVYDNLHTLYVFGGRQELSAETVDILAQSQGAPANAHKWSKDNRHVWTVYWEVQS